jgi:hypothetical protein
MSVGVSHDINASLHYYWSVPNPATFKEIQKAIGWATQIAEELGVETFYDNWLMTRYNEDKNEIEFYFDYDLGHLNYNDRLKLLETQQRRTDAPSGTPTGTDARSTRS